IRSKLIGQRPESEGFMSKEIEAQQVVVKNLLSLVQENPELRILPLVDTECVPSDDYGSWVARWDTAEIDYVLVKNERTNRKSADFEDLVDEVMHDFDFSDEKARKIVDGYEWEKVILVNIVP
ncbi:hypothetical protein, partial [Ruminiclostridium papyrosolvens]|uniref:hypothetical protein n=1 Tax=Ruminiclostridium papyrosolvens TaxID=29362 RepID=UPI00057134DE